MKKEYEHYKGEKEAIKELDELKKSMDNVDSLNYTFDDVKRINRYINEAESADFEDFAKEMRKKYERLPLESNEEYFKREKEDKPFTDKSDKKEDKKDSKVADTKIIDGGIKESTDKHGRIKFEKGNKWADVTSNGGRSDSWIASYGLTHPSGVSWEREKGVTEEQLLNSKSFKTEKGARKWAVEQLKRIASNNIGEFESELQRFVSLVAKNFDESKHKRDEDGKFTDSGNFSGKTVDEQEKELVKELKRLKKNGKAGIDGEKIEDMYKRLTGKEWQEQGAKKEDKKQSKKSQKIDGVKFDKVGKLIPSILKDMEKAYKESK